MEQSKAAPQKPSKISVAKSAVALLIKCLVVLLVMVLVFTFVFGMVRYPDNEMAPSIKVGDLAVFYRLDKRYKASDVVMLKYEGKLQARRVVAVAGDTVDITERGLVINGALQQEKGIFKETLPIKEGAQFPLTLQKGEVFLLGDDRAIATDSRVYGPVLVKDTHGKMMTLLRRRGL